MSCTRLSSQARGGESGGQEVRPRLPAGGHDSGGLSLIAHGPSHGKFYVKGLFREWFQSSALWFAFFPDAFLPSMLSLCVCAYARVHVCTRVHACARVCAHACVHARAFLPTFLRWPASPLTQSPGLSGVVLVSSPCDSSCGDLVPRVKLHFTLFSFLPSVSRPLGYTACVSPLCLAIYIK